MKIIQLIQKPQRRGAEIFAAQLSQSLSDLGHQVLLVSIFEGQAALTFSGKIIQLQRPHSKRLWDWKGWKAFADLVEEFQPDIVQANAADTLKFAVFSQKFFGWKSKLVYRNANQMGDFIKGKLHRSFNQWLLNAMDQVISVSHNCEADFLQTFRFPTFRCCTIPIGIDPEAIELAKQQIPSGLPHCFILQIGGMVPEKNHLGMLRIFAALPNKALHLVFLGQGQLQAELENSVQEMDLVDRVHFMGNQPNVFPYLFHAKALVMPSFIEGLPGVILEAQYCKTPVVAYAVGGIPEVVVSGKTGWLIPKGDEQAFSEALFTILKEETETKYSIAQMAKERVLQQFTLPAIAARFETAYLKLL
jgi:glycosyltransferase involved in cell wall biosynthesis